MDGRITMTWAVTALACACLNGAAAGGEETMQDLETPMERYSQRIVIELADEAAARQAQLEALPLYAGAEWSVSSRWDDTITSDLKMRDVLETHGYKGNFNLGRPTRNFTPEVGRQVLAGGNAIGGHSMTHPYLPTLKRNRLFWEVAAVRAIWEAAADKPICSFAFPFCAWTNELDGDNVQRDIGHALQRAGYYHLQHARFEEMLPMGFEDSPILPGDGKPIHERAAEYLASEEHRRLHPHMSFSMHVWYNTPEAWAQFEGELDRYGGRPNWWYCNQNEYAAYRHQYHHTALDGPLREGNRVIVEIQRPVLRDLNDAVPLTFAVRGVPADKVVSARCETAEIEMAEGAGEARFHLHHDRARALPAAIGHIGNRDNRQAVGPDDADADFADLRGLLHFEDGGLHLTLENDGEPLQNVSIIYRLPLACQEGVVRKRAGDVAGRFEDSLRPALERPDYKYTAGRGFYVAQVDFVRGGAPGRLHLSCRVAAPERDPSYPQGGFLVRGPMLQAELDLDAVRAAARAGDVLTRMGPGWRADTGGPDSIADVEVIETTGGFWNRPMEKNCYLLYSTLHSDAGQEVEFVHNPDSIAAIFLNGERMADGRAELREDKNELVLVHTLIVIKERRCRADNVGCFLRVVKPGTMERVTNIRFEAPTIVDQ